MGYGQYSTPYHSDRTNPFGESFKRKRVRKVYPTDEIPHLWAHQSVARARNPFGNLSFSGSNLKSYSTIIAATVEHNGERVYLLTEKTYSVTTSRQQSNVRYAVRHARVFNIPVEPFVLEDGKTVQSHDETLKAFFSDIEDKLLLAGKSRNPKKLPTIHMNGTSRGELQAQTNTAIYALKKAIKSFQEAAPNGRDYYPQDKGQILGQTMIKAQDEHYDRLTRLQSVLAELVQIQEHLYTE